VEGTDVTQAALRDDLLGRVRNLEPLIRRHADDNEQARRLADPVVAGLRAAQLFHMVTPPALGGLAVDVVTYYRVIEELAAIGRCCWGCRPITH
jgi:GTP cyclohydrolase II